MGKYSDKYRMLRIKEGLAERKNVELENMRLEAIEQSGHTKGIIADLSESFSGEARQTEATRTLPEFRETGEIQDFAPRGVVNQLKLTAGLMATLDTDAQKDIIKEAIPEAEFLEDEKGNALVKIGDKLSVVNKPGLSGQDLVSGLANFLVFLTPAKRAQLAKTIVGKFATGALWSAGTEQALQEVAKLTGSEQPREPVKTVISGLTGGVSEVIGPTIGKIKSLRSGGAEATEKIATSEIADVAARETGIPLFEAQKTLDPYKLEEQSFLAQLPPSAKKAANELKKQNLKAGVAVDDFLESIAPPEALVTGEAKFKTAAQSAIDAKKAIRREAASPIYKKAFEDIEKRNVSEIRSGIIEKMDGWPESGQVYKTLNKVNGFFKGEKSIKELHKIKLEIDDILSSFGDNSIGNTAKRELIDIKDGLMSFMEKTSPKYKEAMEEFKRLSPEVDNLKNYIVGKVANIKDKDLKRVSSVIFDPAESNPKLIMDAKKVIKASDPDAWDELLRVHLEKRLGDMTAEIAETGIEGVENIPKTLHKAIFGNSKHKAMLYRSVDGETLRKMRNLDIALSRAAKGRPGGSQTAIREEIKEKYKSGFIQALRDFIQAPLTKIAKTGESSAYERKIKAMGDIVFDPSNNNVVNDLLKKTGSQKNKYNSTMQLLYRYYDSLNEKE